jgi:hypothetical protein
MMTPEQRRIGIAAAQARRDAIVRDGTMSREQREAIPYEYDADGNIIPVSGPIILWRDLGQDFIESAKKPYATSEVKKAGAFAAGSAACGFVASHIPWLWALLVF